jgi:carbohydrate binding protein with CBM4/9 domain/concanavalin A-like lectin/glucanase superfamily protein
MKEMYSTILCAVFLMGLTGRALEPGEGVELQKTPHQIIKGTQSYLSFDKRTNNEFENTGNTKQPAQVIGDVKSVKGLFGNAIQTSENGSVSIFQKARVSHASIVEFWLNPGRGKKDLTLLAAKSEKKNVGWQLELLSVKENGKLKWTVWHPIGKKLELLSNRSLKKDKWSKVSLAYGAVPGGGGQKAYRIYIDGYLAGETPSYRPIQEITGELIVRTPPDGAIDDLALTLSGNPIYPDLADNYRDIFNLDFEEGAKGWLGVYDECVIDSDVKHNGKNSLRIETDDLYTREYLSPIFSVEPGATYRVSFWAKVDKFDKGYSAIGVWIRWYFAPEETCSFGGDMIAHCLPDKNVKTFDWKKFEAEVTVPEKKEHRKKNRWARLQVKNYHSITKAWIDDIKIEKIAKTKTVSKGDK